MVHLPLPERCALLEQNDISRRTVKKDFAVPKNRNLTDALEQQMTNHPDDESGACYAELGAAENLRLK
jgi:hypothetical protein